MHFISDSKLLFKLYFLLFNHLIDKYSEMGYNYIKKNIYIIHFYSNKSEKFLIFDRF